MKDQIEPIISIRYGSRADISPVLEIAKTWLAAFDPEGTNANGFLFGSPYTKEDLLQIIDAGDLVVAINNDAQIVGYFLVDNFSDNPTSNLYREHLTNLLPNKERICPRAQIAIKEAYQGMGISGKLTAFLKEGIKERYNAIFSIVSLYNPKMPVHERSGWQIIDQNDDFFFVLLPLK